jgi:hypothetical protein
MYRSISPHFLLYLHFSPVKRLDTSLISKTRLPQIYPSHTPHLPLILNLVTRQPQAPSSTLCIPPLSCLPSKPEHNSLKVIAHATLRCRRQLLAAGPIDVFLPHRTLLFHDVENGEETGFGRQFDGNDGVASGGEDGRCEEREVRTDEVIVGA